MFCIGYLVALIPLFLAARTDHKTREIPKACYYFIFFCAVVNLMTGAMKWYESLLGVAVMFIISLFFMHFDYDSIGGGDIKLCLLLGALTGALDSLVVVLIALIILIIICLIRKHKAYAFAVCLFIAYLIYVILAIILICKGAS